MASDSGGSPTVRHRYCTNCGTDAPSAAYCPECGTPMHSEAAPFDDREAAAQRIAASFEAGVLPADSSPSAAPAEPPITPSADDPTLPLYDRRPAPPLSPTADGARHRRRPVIVAAVICAVLAIGGAAAAVVLLNHGHSQSPYRAKLAAAFAPVTDNNRALSDALSRLHGSDTHAAQVALTRTQTVTSAARGALDALAVPSGTQQLASQARQALDREDSYLGAVSGVLANPSSPLVAQLQGLAGNLTSALDGVGAPLAGASQSVSGADNLTTWAQHRAATDSQTGSSQSPGVQGTVTPPLPPSGSGGYTFCDANIAARSATTDCAFAENVFYEYWANQRSPNLSVYSPTTNSTFTTLCTVTAGEVVCTTAQGGEVDFPVAAVDAYTPGEAAAYAGSHSLSP